MLVVSNISLPLSATEEDLALRIANHLRVGERDIHSVRILRKSLDARKKHDIHFQVQAVIALDSSLEKRLLQRNDVHISPYNQAEEDAALASGNTPANGRFVVAGLGPAGLFAAYQLAQYGYRPLVIERGRPVEECVHDVDKFWCNGELDCESNVMFGEGGAGTFSDGKLTTRIKDPRADSVLRILVAHGAPEEITILSKPHIGTDRLRGVVATLRRKIERLAVRYGSLPVSMA